MSIAPPQHEEDATQRREPPPQTMLVTIVAQDPSITVDGRADGPPLTARVRIPAEYIEPGPRGARLHVVDHDPETQTVAPPAITADEHGDPFADGADLDDPAFVAQNVYAVAARTLMLFERALGRRLRWNFDGHQLFLVPRALAERNAFYTRDDRAVLFGHVPGTTPPIMTSLSHDVIAHEVTHAILDGLRPRFLEPSLPDQGGYHEALGDVVALLSVFSLPEIVASLLPAGADDRLRREELTAERLGDTALFALADQLGDDERGGGLRNSAQIRPFLAWRTDPRWAEEHRRGEILVAAAMHALLAIWTERLEGPLERGGGVVERERVVDEGVTSAEHLLGMFMRGVDYLPPVELEFEDVLAAVLAADEVVAPDDGKHGYRDALRDAFAAFGILPGACIADLTQPPRHDGDAPPQPAYERMNYTLLRSDRDELMRFVWENADWLGVDRRWDTRVQFARPSVRVGPDGLSVSEVVADYVQSVQMTCAELAARADQTLPGDVPGVTPLELWGGGLLVLDQFGRAKLHHCKQLDDWDRQWRRLTHLVEQARQDAQGRIGFAASADGGQRVAALHLSDAGGQSW